MQAGFCYGVGVVGWAGLVQRARAAVEARQGSGQAGAESVCVWVRSERKRRKAGVYSLQARLPSAANVALEERGAAALCVGGRARWYSDRTGESKGERPRGLEQPCWLLLIWFIGGTRERADMCTHIPLL